MKTVKITVMKMVKHDDLIAVYENPIEHACDMKLGQIFYSVDGEKPENMCDSAWESMRSFAVALANGEGNFYDGWMKNPYSAMISCNDGFRPVSFLLETIEQ
ncbi:MAG: TIGR04076 family protein [Clostridia bacterium]|nr:TIGR04076 family protein [Clostridia bacterium]